MLTRIHVNQHIIKFNREHGTVLPVLTVKQGNKTRYAESVHKSGPSQLVYKPESPLSCGAVCWDETVGKVFLVGEISFEELQQKMKEVISDASNK